MSFKGFQKAIVRAPQNFRQKLNMGTVTEDAVYADAERRFKELETETKRLADESKRYHKAVNEMLDHQLGFSKAIEEIYKPISGRMSDPNSAIPEGNPEGIEACEQYRDVVNELKEVLKPDLELIESRIIEPANELLKVIQSIRKMAQKRSHKQLDLDRHQNSLAKYQNKKERSAKDEEKMYKYENDVAIAQQEFDYYNEMMKTELPILFQLEAEMVKPLFISLYYMQLNVFYTLSSRMEEMKIPYFDLSQDIVEAFQVKRGDIEERTDAIGITNFKLGHAKSKLDMTRRRFELQNEHNSAHVGPPVYEGPPSAYSASTVATPSTASTYNSYGSSSTYGTPPTTATTTGYGAAGAVGAATGAAAGYGVAAGYGAATASTPVYGGYGGYGDKKDTAAPPGYGAPLSSVSPTPVAAPQGYGAPPLAAAGESCTALYDYTAQAAGDLTFRAGDVIRIVQRTPDQNGWWTGDLNGVQGVFPGNYVQLN